MFLWCHILKLVISSNEVGVPILVPAINENELARDNLGLTFNNGAFMFYESMKWKEKHYVSVKRMHSNTAEGGCVDLLIEELEMLGRINYSKIIQLMGICQTENVESLILMFERIEKGSLYYIMHEEKSVTFNQISLQKKSKEKILKLNSFLDKGTKIEEHR